MHDTIVLNVPFTGIPIVYILLTIPDMKNWTQPNLRFLSWCHIIGSISPWVGSFIYHLFMNLERGEKTYYRLLQLDMIGIWICQSFGRSLIIKLWIWIEFYYPTKKDKLKRFFKNNNFQTVQKIQLIEFDLLQLDKRKIL